MTTAWKKQLALGAITALTLVVGRGSTAMGAPAAQTDEDTLTPSQPSSSSGGDSVESKVGCVDFPLVIKDLSVLARDFSSEGNVGIVDGESRCLYSNWMNIAHRTFSP